MVKGNLRVELVLFLALALVSSSVYAATGSPGAHCGATGDSACRSDLVCYYNHCFAKPFAACFSGADCAGEYTNIMDCFDGQCRGRHAYPCGDVREDPICAPDFHCDISNADFHYCENNHISNETNSCTDTGHVQCSEDQCNIGHPACLEYPPEKTYTVPAGQVCTFTGTITNSGCAWKNPATFSVTGNGCNRIFKYYDCEVKYFSFTCLAGQVDLVADDSSYFTLSHSCEPINPVCGNGEVESGEQCELPNTANNHYCTQSTTACSARKLGTRDVYGDCAASCSCNLDPFNYVCAVGYCNAVCDSNDDCNDNNASTTDTCKDDCTCDHTINNPSCGNNILDSGETCEPPNNMNNVYCPQSTTICSGFRAGSRDAYGLCNSVCGCSLDSFDYNCIVGSCNAVCDENTDCNDNNASTTDICKDDCTCGHNATVPLSCGNGIVDIGEQCELPNTINNAYCNQSNETCSGAKLGVRDSKGDCNYGCACTTDLFNYQCIQGKCGATCDDNADCNDNNSLTIDNCNSNTCACQHSTNNTNPSCGDGKVDYGEQCDLGTSNGDICSAECDKSCYYCDTSCKVRWINGDACDDETPTCVTPPCDYTPVCYDTGCVSPPKLTPSFCGNGVTERGEDCDTAEYNGVICNPRCGSSCNYCKKDCTKVTLQGSPCTQTARPWDNGGMIGYYCEDLLIDVKRAWLDNVCDSNSEDVTYLVKSSNNFYAEQAACDDGYTYIYLSWDDARSFGVLQSSKVFLEHKEALTATWLEYYTICCGWQELCKVPVQRLDTADNCNLTGVNLENVSLRVKIKRTGLTYNSFEMVDHAYLNLSYCHSPGAVCGNNLIESGEECDDGNQASGDGCNVVCQTETAMCGDWSECKDGEQKMICYYGNNVNVKTKPCETGIPSFSIIILLIFLVVMLFIFFLLPYLFMGLATKKKHK